MLLAPARRTRRQWGGQARPAVRANTRLLRALPPGAFPGVDEIEVYQLLALYAQAQYEPAPRTAFPRWMRSLGVTGETTREVSFIPPSCSQSFIHDLASQNCSSGTMSGPYRGSWIDDSGGHYD